MRWGRTSVSAGFLLAVSLALYLNEGNLVPTALLACTLHEVGHLVALALVGGRLIELRLTAIGAEMVVARGLSPSRQLVLVLAGVAANVILAIITAKTMDAPFFVGVNLVLAVLNLVPLSPLDGGQAIFLLTSLIFDEGVAQRVGELLDLTLSWVILAAGIWVLAVGGSFTLLALAIWLMITRKRTKFAKNTCKALSKQV